MGTDAGGACRHAAAVMRMKVDSNGILPQFLISMLQIESIRQRLCANAKDAINQSIIN